MSPTREMVAEIVLDEMSGWHPSSNNAALRRIELLTMCDRLVRYFDEFRAQPVQLDGLPGGHAYTGGAK